MMRNIATAQCLTQITQKINSMNDDTDWDESDSIPSDPAERAKHLEAETDAKFREVHRRLYELERLKAKVSALEGWVNAASGVLVGLLVLITIAAVFWAIKSGWMRLFG